MFIKLWNKVKETKRLLTGDMKVEVSDQLPEPLRCQHCYTKSTLTKEPTRRIHTGHPVVVTGKCGDCGQLSHWVREGAFWFSATVLGIPTEGLRESEEKVNE